MKLKSLAIGATFLSLAACKSRPSPDSSEKTIVMAVQAVSPPPQIGVSLYSLKDGDKDCLLATYHQAGAAVACNPSKSGPISAQSLRFQFIGGAQDGVDIYSLKNESWDCLLATHYQRGITLNCFAPQPAVTTPEAVIMTPKPLTPGQ